eukprot:1725745-Alexandrium_andersonii.AAC.1
MRPLLHAILDAVIHVIGREVVHDELAAMLIGIHAGQVINLSGQSLFQGRHGRVRPSTQRNHGNSVGWLLLQVEPMSLQQPGIGLRPLIPRRAQPRSVASVVIGVIG